MFGDEDGVVVEFVITLATALLFLPIIFSPIIALEDTFAIELNSIWSKVGSWLFKDSYMDKTLYTSG